MPADNEDRSADPAAPGAEAADTPGEDAEDVPMNRAERRAKGKKSSQPQAVGKIVPGRVNQSHGPRSYANRRSGGGR